MTINYTSLLGLAQPVTGTEQGTWGTVVNDEITALIEEAIAGGETINVTSGDVTLTDTDGVANQARNAILLVTGTPGVSRNIIAPSQSKWYIVKNSSDASVVLKGSATTGVTILAGTEALCFWNGSDFEIVGVNGPSSSTDNAVVRFDGTTGKVIQNSGVTIDDSNNVSGVAQLNATTADLTNIEVTNIKAKDGTASASIADSTGVFTHATTTVFPAGAVGTPSITTAGDTNTGIFFPAADTIAFAEGGAEAMRIDSSGNVTLQKNISVGGATPTTSGTGITFPATQSASSDANTLDDYEEGTWPPATTGLTFTDAVYTKIGRVVTVRVLIENNSGGGVSLDSITGLPFTASPTIFVGNVISDTGPYVPYTVGATIRIRDTTNNAVTLANGNFVYVTITYFV